MDSYMSRFRLPVNNCLTLFLLCLAKAINFTAHCEGECACNTFRGLRRRVGELGEKWSLNSVIM